MSFFKIFLKNSIVYRWTIIFSIMAKYAIISNLISMWRVQYLCENNQLNGVERLGKTWAIPKGTPKPIDGRSKAAKLQNEE